MRSAITAWLGLLLMSGMAWGDSAADQYHDYVDHAIPVSFEVVKTDAQFRELKVVLDNLKDVQGHLANVSDSSLLVEQLTPLVIRSDDLSASSVDELISQLLIATQIKNAAVSAQAHLDAASEIITTEQTKACSGGFDLYDVSHAVSDYKPDISAADGIYVEGPDVLTMLATLFESIWQVISNNSEQKRIEEDSARLDQQRAKSSDYQKFAHDACIAHQSTYAQNFTAFSALVPSYSAWLQEVSKVNYDRRIAMLNSLIERRAVNDVASLVRTQSDAVATKLLSDREKNLLVSMDTKVRLRTRYALDQIPSSSCTVGESLLEGVSADLSLANLYHLPSYGAVRDLLASSQSAFQQRCGGSAQHQMLRASLLQAYVEQRTMRRPMRSLEELGAATFAPGVGKASCFGGTGADTLCNRLVKASSDMATYANTDGGVCRSSTFRNYSSCGSVGIVVDSVGGEDPWSLQRSTVAIMDHLPGRYTAERAATEAAALQKQIDQIRKNVDDTKSLTSDLVKSNSEYIQKSVPGAVSGEMQTAQLRGQGISGNLAPKTAADPVAMPSATVTAAGPVVSPNLRKWIESLPSGNSMQQFSSLQSLWEVNSSRLGDLPNADTEEIRKIYDEYFDSNGVIREIPGLPTGMPAGISNSLRTSEQTIEGRDVRRELNRSLYEYSTANDPSSKQMSLGAAALIVGADGAYADGAHGTGDYLTRNGAALADAALGFIPVVGGLNDLTQIAFGIVTGSDYAGRPMTAADYAFRGVGAVLSLFPTAVVRVGAAVIDRAFLDGASLLRRLRMGDAIRPTVDVARQTVFDFASGLGRWLPESITIKYPDYDVEAILEQLSKQQIQLSNNIASGLGTETWVLGLLNETKNTAPLTVPELGTFIPDFVDWGDRVLGEIKSSKDLVLDSQMQKYIQFCRSDPRGPFSFRLYVMPDTTISAELAEGLKSIGASVFDVDPRFGVRPRPLP